MADSFGDVEVGDECAHQPRFADASCQREAERREITLEAAHGRKLRADSLQRKGKVTLFF